MRGPTVVNGCAIGRVPAVLVADDARRLGRLVVFVLAVATLAGQALAGQRPDARAPSREGEAAPPAGPSPEARAIAALLDRAVGTAPGTYVTSGSAFEPLTDGEPMFVQADVLRGPDQTIRAAVSLGAQVSQPVVTRARIVAANGTSRAVVSDMSGSSPAGVVRVVNQLALAPGEYELHAAMAHPGSGGSVVASLAKSRLVVADLWRSTLALTPLVLGDAVAPAPAASAAGPFTFGPTALRPAAGNRFPQAGDLHVAFRIFSWAAKAGEKPDLLVEYVFHERTPSRAQFFNKVKPQRLNADTLGDRFDPAAGVVNAGMSIPLAPFPFSEFRVTVRVTDNRTKQTASQEAHFVVVP